MTFKKKRAISLTNAELKNPIDNYSTIKSKRNLIVVLFLNCQYHFDY